MDLDPAVVASAKIAAGAAAGGLVRMFLRPARTWKQAAMLIASCVTCGTYATPPIMHWWAIPLDYMGSVGALTGLLGLSAAQAALDLNFRDLIARFIGRA